MNWSKKEPADWRYDIQQRTLDEIASRLGVVAYRPDYHRKDRDKNTVLFYVLAECIWQIKDIVFYYYGA